VSTTRDVTHPLSRESKTFDTEAIEQMRMQLEEWTGLDLSTMKDYSVIANFNLHSRRGTLEQFVAWILRPLNSSIGRSVVCGTRSAR
jgi:hypothetical protein